MFSSLFDADLEQLRQRMEQLDEFARAEYDGHPDIETIRAAVKGHHITSRDAEAMG